jgi:hypothetical protein
MNASLPALPGRPRLAELRLTLQMFGVRGWAVAALGALATALLIGIPAALIENPVFGRQLAARPEDYVFLALASVLAGLIAGTFAVSKASGYESQVATGGFLSFLAVGCPVCNKAAVVALGTTGALNIFGPAQLFIGIASVLLLAWTLMLRARSVAGDCDVR